MERKKISQQCKVVEISCTRCDRAHSSKSRPRKRPRLDSCSNASSATLHSHFLLWNLASCSYFATILPFCPSFLVLHQHRNERVEEQLAISYWITVCNNILRKSALTIWKGAGETTEMLQNSEIRKSPPQLFVLMAKKITCFRKWLPL